MSKVPYARGFATLEQETGPLEVPVQGRLPAWLSGTLVRNGPAKFEVGTQAYRHWFDGLAMLHAFVFQNGRVAYTNRFLESQSFLEAKARGKISRGEFGTMPHRSLFGRIIDIVSPRRTDNASVSVTMLADRYVALTEAPVPI